MKMLQGRQEGFAGAENFETGEEPFFGEFGDKILILDGRGFGLLTETEEFILEARMTFDQARIMVGSMETFPEIYTASIISKGIKIQ